jgi:uncharacterized protein (DUF934 family)
MRRRLLRNGTVVVDDWDHLDEDFNPAETAGLESRRLIIPFERWAADRAEFGRFSGLLGVVVQPAHRIEDLAQDLQRFSLVSVEFPGPAEGRGYTQARLLRERYAFKGELRASGYVRRDQLFFMARCGFNAFELPEIELKDASAALMTFTATYQPANDAGLPARLLRR